MRTITTFEQAYRQQPFAELVRLGILLGKTIRRQRDSRQATRTAPVRA